MRRVPATTLRDVGTLFGPGTLSGLPDAELLRRFLTHRDRLAFEAIIASHGPSVMANCRSILGDQHAADDAFQATFLILVRKAASISVHGSLAPWLSGVSRRVATRAARQAMRRSSRMPTDLDIASADPTADAQSARADLAEMIREEVARLPETFRLPIVAHYFEGLSHEDSATRLRWPIGTVKGRLARARKLLRDRLGRRGLGVSTAIIALTLSEQARAKAVPHPLRLATARAATRLLRTARIAGAAECPAIASLTQGALTSMTWAKISAAGLLAACTVLGGVGIVAARQARVASLKDNLAQAPAGGPIPIDVRNEDRLQVEGTIAEAQNILHPADESKIEAWGRSETARARSTQTNGEREPLLNLLAKAQSERDGQLKVDGDRTTEVKRLSNRLREVDRQSRELASAIETMKSEMREDAQRLKESEARLAQLLTEGTRLAQLIREPNPVESPLSAEELGRRVRQAFRSDPESLRSELAYEMARTRFEDVSSRIADERAPEFQEARSELMASLEVFKKLWTTQTGEIEAKILREARRDLDGNGPEVPARRKADEQPLHPTPEEIERRVRRAFLRDPEARSLQAEWDEAKKKYEVAKRRVLNPGDPTRRRAKQEMEQAGDRYTGLWERRYAELKAEVLKRWEQGLGDAPRPPDGASALLFLSPRRQAVTDAKVEGGRSSRKGVGRGTGIAPVERLDAARRLARILDDRYEDLWATFTPEADAKSAAKGDDSVAFRDSLVRLRDELEADVAKRRSDLESASRATEKLVADQALREIDLVGQTEVLLAIKNILRSLEIPARTDADGRPAVSPQHLTEAVDYIIDIGDEIRIEERVGEKPRAPARSYRVSKRGTIELANVGEFPVAGLGLAELKRQLAHVLKRDATDDRTAFTIWVVPAAEFAHVRGLVARPGRVKAGGLVGDAMKAAGGLKEGIDPDACEVVLTRVDIEGRVNDSWTFDLGPLLRAPEEEDIIGLRPGDLVDVRLKRRE